MGKFLDEVKFSGKLLVVLFVLIIIAAIAIGLSFGLLKLINEDLLDLIAGLMLTGILSAAAAAATFYLFRFFTKPRSDAPICASVIVVMIIMIMHMAMTVQLRGIKKEFLSVAKNAPNKILWGAGEINPKTEEASNPITYGGKIDAVVAKRNAFLKKRGYIGLGSWYVGEYKEVQFQMVYIWFPLRNLWG